MGLSADAFENLRIENDTLKQQLDQYQQAYEQLKQQLADLLRYRFGKKSERFIDLTNPQLDLFADKQAAAEAGLPSEQATTPVAAHQRSKKAKDTSRYPRVIEIIPVSAADRVCSCGCQKQVIRYETKELLHYQAAVFHLVEQRREVVACTKGCELSVKTAPAPLHVLPKVKATESLLAHVVVSKIHHRQPLYHLEKYGSMMGLSRETLARWVIQLVPPVQPLFNLMQDSLIEYDIASIDATTLQVLNEPGRPAERKSYVYCIRGGPPLQSVVLYSYNHSKHKQFVDGWLAGFTGTVHMDAAPCFEFLLQDPKVQASFCNAHARRKFEAVAKLAKKQGLAQEALRFYKKLYKIERQAKDNKLEAVARAKLRQQESRPLMVQFKLWLDTNCPLVLPQSPLGQAFRYCLNHWDGLVRFLDDGRLEIDNNLTEQQIKPFVIARKNFMFANSMAGAHALCMHFSLIRTALAHNLDPYQYYLSMLKQLPHCQSVEDYEKLLPWNIQLLS